jgi:hypothetical protein
MSCGKILSLKAPKFAFFLLIAHGLEFILCSGRVFFMERLGQTDEFVRYGSFGMNWSLFY